MTAILIFSAGICLAYIILISRYISGWNQLPVYKIKNREFSLPVSVIIAVRNEEEQLPRLIKMLANQTYPVSLLEIIFSNDHSSDHSEAVISGFVGSRPNTRLVALTGRQFGKKMALANAALQAKGELLLFTDADCSMGKDWVMSIVNCYLESNAVLIASPVAIKSAPAFFSRFQALELFSLTGSTAGAFSLNDPVMVNGANLAVKKDVYLESLPYLETGTPSGDDIFLMLHLKKIFPDRLVFFKNTDSVVEVEPITTMHLFIRQRIRWVSKSKYYRDKSMILTALIVLLVNLSLLNCLLMSFVNPAFIYAGVLIFLSKSTIDFIFLRKVLAYFGKGRLLRIFAISQFLYFLYVSFTGIVGNFARYKWKGRVFK